jgi:hypothetical protein
LSERLNSALILAALFVDILKAIEAVGNTARIADCHVEIPSLGTSRDGFLVVVLQSEDVTGAAEAVGKAVRIVNCRIEIPSLGKCFDGVLILALVKSVGLTETVEA